MKEFQLHSPRPFVSHPLLPARLLQTFVCVIDEELLQAVQPYAFETENVEDMDPRTCKQNFVMPVAASGGLDVPKGRSLKGGVP